MIFNPGLVPQASGGGGGAVVGTYVGDNTTKRVIELPIEPAILYIVWSRATGSTGMHVTMYFQGQSYGAGISNDSAVRRGGTLIRNIFTTSGSTADIAALNQSGATITYIAIPKA